MPTVVAIRDGGTGVTNWGEYDAGLVHRRGNRGVDGRTTHDSGSAAGVLRSRDSDGLTLRAVFRLAFRQTEGLIGSLICLLGLTLAIPGHSTLWLRAETLKT